MNQINHFDFNPRPIYEISTVAAGFVSDIKMISENSVIDVKSIMGLLSFIGGTDKEVNLKIEGNDKEEAKRAMAEAFSERGYKVNVA